MISREIQVLVESVSARFNEDNRNLFGVNIDQLSERESEILLEHVETDSCLSCGPTGVDCEGQFLTFWQDKDATEMMWQGKRECIPVSSLLNNTLNGINEVSQTLRDFDPESITEMLKVSNVEELGEKLKKLKPPKSLANLLQIVEEIQDRS